MSPVKSTEKSTGKIEAGEKAPDFKLLSDEGQQVSLSDFRGKKVVLYFYPKDMTPGCTKEACSFSDGSEAIAKLNGIVLGISADSPESHKKFKEKHHLTFPLLSDVNKEVIQAYGVWKEKSLYGRKFMGIERTTFIIDEEGKIIKIFTKVKVEGHLEEVLKALHL